MNFYVQINQPVLLRNNVLVLRIMLSYLIISQYFLNFNASEVAILEDTANNKTSIAEHPVIIIVSYDGFRYDYMRKTDTPYLDQIKAKGISTTYMMNQFPTKTFPNHHSIATGLHTESHGVTDNRVFDVLLNKTLGIEDEEFYNFRSDVLPLWILNELAGDGRASGCLMWPGSKFPYGTERTLPTYLMGYNKSFSFESRVDVILDWITNKTRPANLIFMYFDEPDTTAHKFGPESLEVQTAIQRMDNLTGYFIDKLKGLEIFEKVNLVFLSDHGFEEVSERNVINITGIIDPTLYKKYGDSPVYNIDPVEGEIDIVYSAFQNATITSNFSVFKRDELNKLKPHWFYQNNARRIMPLIAVADSGFVFDDHAVKNWTMAYLDGKSDGFHNTDRVYGVHGYDNHDRTMQPYFIAHGPLFRSGEVVEPFRTIDLFPLLCQLLDIPEPPNNGTASSVQVLLLKKGFHLQGPVGWAIGGSVVLALSILIGIIYLMSHHQRRQHPLLSSNVTYRFVNNQEDFIEDCLEVTSKICEVNEIPMMEVDEYESLLRSSSNEEL